MMQTDEDTKQTHNTHIMHFLNCEPATKKSLVHTLYINQSPHKVFIVSIHLLTHHFLNMGGGTIIGCPVTQPVGLNIRPHYRYLSPIIISKKVPLYDVP